MNMFVKKYWPLIFSIIYIILPLDLIPDVIPLFGGIDDSLLLVLGLIKQDLTSKELKKSNGV